LLGMHAVVIYKYIFARLLDATALTTDVQYLVES
jgi:hypothetical protein